MTETTLAGLLENAEKCLKHFSISNNFVIDFIYNSLCFENDKISIADIKRVIIDGQITAERMDIIIRNHYAALIFTMTLVKNDIDLDENKIKDIHELLMQDLSVGGLYRNVDISIKGSNHTPPSYMKVYDRMKKYINTIRYHHGDVFELAAYSHLQLAKIHPFLDGNGRCSRLVLFYYFIKNNLNPIIIPYNDKEKYFYLLEEFKVNKNINPFIDYLKQLSNISKAAKV
ncbi:MAG: Fic family protein [Bacilli bacterium]|nr:Fic family protein [Bacilli bacterium]MDD4387816.1 Fic family protein [Bacilli bacterium]